MIGLGLGLVLTVLPTTEAAPQHDVVIASYNAWMLPLGASDDTSRRRAEMPPAVLALGVDIVCMQEVWTDTSLAMLRAGFARELPAVAEAPGGLVIFSRWPLSDVSFHPYPVHPSLSFIERLGNKGFVTATVSTPAGPLRVVDTHLAHGATKDAKLLQLSTLVADLVRMPEVPTVLCGDLNVRGGDPALAAITDLGFRDAAGPTRSRTRVGWPRTGQPRGGDPDYIMVRDGLQTLSVLTFRQALDTPETALSDHNLQLTRVRLAPRE